MTTEMTRKMTAQTQSFAQPLSIFVVAAEESGDALGAALARALVTAEDGVRLSGVGGMAMAANGIVSPFSIHELAIIGVTAIPRRLPTI
jgi:lipid-A-disaccharide synthase